VPPAPPTEAQFVIVVNATSTEQIAVNADTGSTILASGRPIRSAFLGAWVDRVIDLKAAADADADKLPVTPIMPIGIRPSERPSELDAKVTAKAGEDGEIEGNFWNYFCTHHPYFVIFF
jgi:hypothetical protein